MRSNRLFALLIFLFFIPRTAPCQTVSIDYWLGFDGRFQLGKWTPLTVTFENRSRGINGRCEVLVTAGSEYRQNVTRTIYSTDVELP